MTRFAVLLMLVTAITPFALHAQPEGKPAIKDANPSLKEQLRDTLQLAYRGRIAEYKAGRAPVANLVRINRELYEAEIAFAPPADHVTITKSFIMRASEIEQFAELNENGGTGTRTDALDAKAARLRAMMELTKLNQ